MRYIHGHHYTAKIVHHVILVTLAFTIDSLWNFFNVALQVVLEQDLPDPKGPVTTPSPQQATAEASKQVHAVAIAKASKKWGNGSFNAKTST